jgi:hypothetical protein
MFVQFTIDHTKKRILVNSDHVRSADEVDGHNNRVRLILSGQGTSGHCEEVEGDLESVQATLMGERTAF